MAPAGREWAMLTRVDQFFVGCNDRDCMGYLGLALRELLRGAGYTSDIYACFGDAVPPAERKDPHSYTPASSAAVILHYTTGHELNEFVARLPVRKILYYHNVTPAAYFTGIAPGFERESTRGRGQLTALLKRFDHVWTNSTYSADELRRHGAAESAVVGVLGDFSRLAQRPDPDMQARCQAWPHATVLFVGRVFPHKGDEALVDVARVLQQEMKIPVRFLRVGPVEGKYREIVQRRIGAAGLTQYHLLGECPQAVVNACYRNADVFLCLSEHEGFCMPLVEAMYFDVPIVALDRCAVRETLAGSGVLVKEAAPRQVARAVAALLRDNALRGEVIAAQRNVLERYRPAAVGEYIVRQLAALAAGSGQGAA